MIQRACPTSLAHSAYAIVVLATSSAHITGISFVRPPCAVPVRRPTGPVGLSQEPYPKNAPSRARNALSSWNQNAWPAPEYSVSYAPLISPANSLVVADGVEGVLGAVGHQRRHHHRGDRPRRGPGLEGSALRALLASNWALNGIAPSRSN